MRGKKKREQETKIAFVTTSNLFISIYIYTRKVSSFIRRAKSACENLKGLIVKVNMLQIETKKTTNSSYIERNRGVRGRGDQKALRVEKRVENGRRIGTNEPDKIRARERNQIFKLSACEAK